MVLALGIVATAVIGVFGLLPTGLNVFREAQQLSITAEIAQQIINDAQQTDFSALTDPTTRYFDGLGVEITAAAQQPFSVYETRTRVKKSVAISGRVSANIATVVVNVANNPGKQPLSLDTTSGIVTPVPGVTVSTYTGLVSSNQ